MIRRIVVEKTIGDKSGRCSLSINGFPPGPVQFHIECDTAQPGQGIVADLWPAQLRAIRDAADAVLKGLE